MYLPVGGIVRLVRRQNGAGAGAIGVLKKKSTN